jgi:two-component system sensor histidine kinase HydH
MRSLSMPEVSFSRYALPMGVLERSWLKGRKTGVLLVALPILALAGLNVIIPASDITTHNILHHLNFLPLMIAGMLFGVRGATIAAFSACVMNAPLIVRHWVEWPLDAKDQVVELSIFSAAGLIAGYLSDRERAQRRDLERTRQELEGVYLELRENITEMKKAERLSAAGQLAASLAHEIRNPLASISGAAGILQRGSAPPEYLEDSLDIIQKESHRLNKLLTGFLNFAKPRSLRMQRTDPNDLLLSVASLASHAAIEHRIALNHTSVPCPEIECDPEQLKQVLLNVVINAIEASAAGSSIELRASLGEESVAIEVADTGEGIPDDIMEQIYDPFFTTKAKGTGLGLAISSMILSQHNGSLSFRKNKPCGTIFCIELPVQSEGAHG